MITKDIKPISDLRASAEYRDTASQVLLVTRTEECGAK
jgi:xanthine dehydrogenase iron-sulfur cluster and FAD-binding subunit A